MTRRERLAELIEAERARHHDRTGCRFECRGLVVHLGMSPAEFFADQLDAESYPDLVVTS